MKRLKYYCHIYAVRFKYEFKIFTNFPLTNFLVGVLAFLLQIGGLLFISILFSNTNDIDEFNIYQMLALYGFAQITRGLDHFIQIIYGFSQVRVLHMVYMINI